MVDDRQRRRATRRADRMALHPQARIFARLLVGALGDRHPLDADQKALAVHHREHQFEAAVFFADPPADRPLPFAVGHDAGGRGMNAELFFKPQRAQIVALARPAICLGQEFRHQEQRDAAAAGRRVGGARQHHVDDVVAEIVVAIGDEDLLAGDPVMLAPALVMARHRAGPERAEVGAGLRLGQVHRPGPFARRPAFRGKAAVAPASHAPATARSRRN